MYNKISYFQNKEDLPEITPHKDLTAYKDLNSYLQSTLSTDKFDLNIRYLIINKDEEINFYIYFENIALQYFHDNPFLIAFLNSNEEDERLILSLDMGWDRKTISCGANGMMVNSLKNGKFLLSKLMIIKL